MSVESVRAFFAAHAPDISVIESDKSSATVALAAEVFGVTPSEIAKTLSLRVGNQVLLVVTCGTARLDNKKARAVFGGKPRMLSAEEALDATGHPVGGICPFGLKTPLKIFCDISLKNFPEVVPAAGSVSSAVRISPARMAALTDAEWVDVCEAAVRPAMNPPAEALKSEARTLTCPRCGTAFSCNLSGGCWCAAESARLPMPTGGEDCLCRNCLRAEAERQTAAR